MSENDRGFKERLSQVFNGGSMAEIARQLDLPHATIRNYFGGRLPSPEVLILIANETNVSLNWLLTGSGEMYAGSARGVDLGQLIDDRILELLERRLSPNTKPAARAASQPKMVGFDVLAALKRFTDPDRIMGEWFKFEHRKYPKDFGVVFFQGWETFSTDEKIDAINDAKKVLDRTLRER